MLQRVIERVIVTNRIHADVEALLAQRFDLTVNRDDAPWPRSALLERAKDADAILAFMTDLIDDAFLAECPRLKIVAGALKGYDNFDEDACTRRGVWLTNVPDLLTEPTADLAVGLMISLSRNVAPGDRMIRAGKFAGWRPVLYGVGLTGARVGVIGAGAVGRAVIERLAGFRCEIRYFDPRPLSSQDEAALKCAGAPLRELFAESEFIVVASPLTSATYHLIDAELLSRVRRGAYLINVARGSLVNEAAVAEALSSGVLAGYAADVFEFEDWRLANRPKAIAPQLLALADKTLLTPHIGSAVGAVRHAIEVEAASNIIDVAERRAPRGAVNQPQEATRAC